MTKTQQINQRIEKTAQKIKKLEEQLKALKKEQAKNKKELSAAEMEELRAYMKAYGMSPLRTKALLEKINGSVGVETAAPGNEELHEE